jgi:large repetitive protein
MRNAIAKTLLVFFGLACFTQATFAINFPGTNAPGATSDFPFTTGAGATNLSLTISNTLTAYSHLLLKAGGTPSDTNYDFIAQIDGPTNAINLEAPELKPTNWVLRVRTPLSSLTNSFVVTMLTNISGLRTTQVVTKPLIFTNQGTINSGFWNYYRVEMPTNVSGWRVILSSGTNVGPDLYIQRDQPPTLTSWLKRNQSWTNDIIAFTPTEAGAGAWFIGVFQPSGSNAYTLRTEMITFTTLTWDPGTTDSGTQVYSNGTANGDYYFKITAQNTAVNAWRSRLSVIAGEANLYLSKGTPPSISSNLLKSERIGSDGFVIGSGTFNAGEDWYYMVHADPASQFTLVTGEPFVTDLGVLATNGASGSGTVAIGPEGMRFFKTGMPSDVAAWRLYLNGLTNTILVSKTSVPIPGTNDLNQAGQMLVVPPYLVSGLQYFVGVAGNPGLSMNLDSRQQPFTDIPFSSTMNLNIVGYDYAVFRVQVPVDEIAWQVSVVVSNGNPNVAVRRSLVPNENNNDAFSEVAGTVTDSILLVPPTLSDGAFFITVYGTNNYTCQLQTGAPDITEINFNSVTVNNDPNRVGWRLFKVSDISQQLGALGWDLFVTNFTAGTKIALRRNAAPGIWTYRTGTTFPLSAGVYDFLSTADFLQRPGHQADVWYVGVYNPSNALGNFTLVTRELTADPITFDGGSAVRTNVPPGKWQFFRADIPAGIVGWDVRATDVKSGIPQVVVKREGLPTSLLNVGFFPPITSTNWASGNQWAAVADWTTRPFTSDGATNETGRILTMGFMRPMDQGTYYVGVFNNSTSNMMSCTVLSRGIGPSNAIPVQTLNYVGTANNPGLPARDLAVYAVTITSNTPSWKVRLTPTAGDVLLAVGKDFMPNISAPNNGSVTNTFTPGKKILKAGNEQYVQLPGFSSNLLAGTYDLVVISEGITDPAKPTFIGTGSASYVLESFGPMSEIDFGLLDTNDIVYAGGLQGGESAAFHFHNYPWPITLGFELSLENKTGNPYIVSRGSMALADPGAANPPPAGGVFVDPYGNEGGWPDFLAVSPGFITVSGADDDETVMVKARDSGGVYNDSNYTLRIRKLVPRPLTFDTGTYTMVNTSNNYEFFQVDVPTNALGWDVRLTNITGSVKMIVCRDALALDVIPLLWNPATATSWPSFNNWIAAKDWSQRSQSYDGTVNEDGRILAMGMGLPLEPGRYYVGVRNLTPSTNATYTIMSRGIGGPYSIPVIDLPFTGGSATNLALPAREAAYYRVIIPGGATSWQAKLTTLSGEALMMVMTNTLPSVLSGRAPAPGSLMQKFGNEHFLTLPFNGFTAVPPLTNYILVASEGIVSNSFPNRIGLSNISFVIESRGELVPVNLGSLSDTEVFHTNTLEGGEVRAYQFNVPPGAQGVEARLFNVTGNPAMVLRVGSPYPNPGQASPSFGPGSVNPDFYGNTAGQLIAIGNGDANTNLITVANPSNGVYSVLVKARANASLGYSNANYTIGMRTISYLPVTFDGGTAVVTNHIANTWKYFRVDVPADTNALGWDIRVTNVLSGFPRLVVRRDVLPFALTTTPWFAPGSVTNWPTTNQWAGASDWTRRQFTADGATNEDGRILAMGMGQPLEPGTYYVGVFTGSGTNAMNYTLLSRGIGNGMTLPVIDLPFNGASVTNNNLPAREAVYYRVSIPSNTPSWKLKLTPTSGEVMLVVMTNRVPNVDTGHVPTGGKFMQKAGNEHYILLPPSGQTNIAAGIYYIAVISEGLNPANSTRVGSGGSSYVLTSVGASPVTDLGTVSLTDTISSETLEGGESRIYKFLIPTNVLAVELRLQNRVGNPVLSLSSGPAQPDPGSSTSGPSDLYGNDGGTIAGFVNSDIITFVNPTNGIYALAIKARVSSLVYPDASFTLHVKQLPVPDLNFTSELNTNGLSNVSSGLLADNQRAFYRVIVPTTNVLGKPILGWMLDVSQISGAAGIRARKDVLPSDTFFSGMPICAGAAVVAPTFLVNGTWFVEVHGTNSTAYTLTSSSLVLQRAAWLMPGVGETNTTPGVSAPLFADSGVDTNGVALPGDQGIDLEFGKYHYYAVTVPTNCGGLMRVQMDAISGNADLFIRTNLVPTASHTSTGSPGTTQDRSLTGTATEYANWVPLLGRTETHLPSGTWYFAVRAVNGANARYRLRLSTGNVQPLDFYSGTVTNQVVAGGDWRYYSVQLPYELPANWTLTFSQQAGDVVLYLRDTIPPGNGATTISSDYKDWGTDLKNHGPYPNFDLPGTYPLTVPPVRPGSVYYIGVRAKSDSIFSITSTTSGPTNAPLTIIPFYNGYVTNVIPPGGSVAYRIVSPPDSIRWRHTSVHSNIVNVYIDNGSMPTLTTSDNFSSSVANSSQDRLLTSFPWLPDQNYFMVATNKSAVPQPFSFTMNGASYTNDDDADGMLDGWEVLYFGTMNTLPGADGDLDGVVNLNEFQEGTNPIDKNSFLPRLLIFATNGVVNVNPPGTNFLMGTNVTVTATPNPGFLFLGWTGSATGTANPLFLVMNTNKTLVPRFRVPGDDFDQRITLSGFIASSSLSNSNATKEAGEPNHAGNAGGKSLWWTWQVPASGTVTITTAGTTFRNALAVYTGSTVSNLTIVATNLPGAGTNTSVVTFSATAGTIYQIAVDGFNGAAGNVVVSVSLPGAIVLQNPAKTNGIFQFTVISGPGQPLRIDSSTNFQLWTPLTTFTNISGSSNVFDPGSTGGFPRRYYRGVVIP